MCNLSSKNRLKTAAAFRQTAPKEFRNLLLLKLSGFEICWFHLTLEFIKDSLSSSKYSIEKQDSKFWTGKGVDTAIKVYSKRDWDK